MSAAKKRAYDAYLSNFGTEPQYLVRAPGRVNIIGEHTDYNDGFVLPCAIDRDTVVAIGPSSSEMMKIISCDFDACDEFDPRNVTPSHQSWAQYVRGMASHLNIDGYEIATAQMAIAGDVPLGSGLSSSASLEIAVGLAMVQQSGLLIELEELALIAQKAENQFVGCSCGIMDQLISAKAQKDHALLIDCRSLATEAISIPDEATIIIVNSGITHSNIGGEYNERRTQCEHAAAHYGVRALRDIDMNALADKPAKLDELSYRRARHVVSENERTLLAAQALKNGDLNSLGDMLRSSHISMRDDFEITLPEIDKLSDMMNEIIGIGGARMTGGGFGGCVIGIAASQEADTIIENINMKYQTPLGQKPKIFKCKPWSGADILN